MLWKKLLVKKHERGLLLRDGDFERILPPGRHYLFDPLRQLQLETVTLSQPRFTHALADYLRQHAAEVVDEHFHRVELGDDEAALRFEGEQLVEILPPGHNALYWRAAGTLRLERIQLRDTRELPAGLLSRLTQTILRGRAIAGLAGVLNVQVPAGHVGVLRCEGEALTLLQPGRYGYWRFNRDIAVELVDTRLQALEVSGQEILTRDKVSLRLNLTANWQYSDVGQAFSLLPKPAEHLYRELQLLLRAAVGTRTLDELLENKQLLDRELLERAGERLAGCGLALQALGVKDIILPGEMKALLSQVVEAEKAAQANVIRRREETGATRSLLNTARVMEDNPTALRLKELETLERLAERIDKISVIGGLDQLLNGLVKIGR
ncbi:slipin family protein [Vogesella amnigena]|uniref:Slipin family protein n=1 Tax=Vogesella amnigena TaxID=1507449 RepID=A0ABV7TUW5_9NEIS